MPLLRARHLWLFAPALLLAAAWCVRDGAGLTARDVHMTGEPRALGGQGAPAPAAVVAQRRERSAAIVPLQASRQDHDFDGQPDLYRYALQLKSAADGGDAQASWRLSRVYDYCAGYAVDPAGYQADDRLVAQGASAGVQAMLAARGRVAQRCAGFSSTDGLGAQAVTLQRLRAAEAGSLAAEAALLAQGKPLDESPDYRRELVQRVLVSRDPEAYLALSAAMGAVASGDEAYRGYVAGTQISQLAWQLAACKLGLDCGARSPLMTSYCANGGICSQDSSQDFANFVLDAAVPRQGAGTLDDMVSTLVNGSGGST
ncbi:hypothetical protein [Pseudoxanthomonas sp.]|uniref:hypothetical protein n=1 Tax=Pseudoxanthomonas sp. TaxID=1871049 RepID=UPI002630D3FF|nr:hypothetical protein [Pseudoxanthomonas sp.]WDS37959.1 MAG: hypothetical protein O8I58_08900 [Pseudoxanthomonas sp.]